MTATHREKYFRENDGVCENCGAGDIHVHHRDGDATNDAAENLVGLCASCHRKVHHGARDSEFLSELIDDVGEFTGDAFDASEYEGVPENATVTVKETCPGQKYYYWQWRDGDRVRSEYIEPVSDSARVIAGEAAAQSSLAEW